MPVWYEEVKALVAQEQLVQIGITQEQHPDRCRLFAQWKGLEFPILWDPFNLTDSRVVPNFTAIDEHGIVRSTRPQMSSFEEDFLALDFEAPEAGSQPDFARGACSFTELHGQPSPISALSQQRDVDTSVEALVKRSAASAQDATSAFHAGVALRLRYDSPHSRAGDFQAAIDHWTRALRLDPNQYIWRRRIQQYGPRMDQPYPFYTWTEEARREILARGETPVPLVAALTPTELAEPSRPPARDLAEPKEPDPRGEIRRDEAALVAIESAVAFDTSKKKPIASVHLALRPSEARDVHWNHEAGPPLQIWIGAPISRLLAVEPRPDTATSAELSVLSFEVELPPGVEELVLPAYALYHLGKRVAGKCLYLRQDFEVRARKP